MEFIKKLVAIIYIPKWYMFKDDKKDHVEHDEKRPHPSERGFHLLRYIYMYVYNSSKYGCTIHPTKIKISRLTQEIVLDLTIDKRHLPFPRIVTNNLPVKWTTV